MPAVGVGIQATIVASNQSYSSTFSASYTTQGGAMLVQFSGSAWTNTASNMLSVNLTMNNATMGTASVWANAEGTHMALIPIVVAIIPQSPGTLVFSVVPKPGTTTVCDQNDLFNILVWEFPVED